LRDLQRQYADRRQGAADAAERDRREDIRNELGDRRDALRAQLDLEMQALDARRAQLDAEWDAVQALFVQRLSNAQLYAEARPILERGVNEQLIADLWAFEKEFGEGMGILGEYVKTRLTQQILIAGEALQNLANNVLIATDQNLFERVIGQGITVRDILAEMFNVTSLNDLINRINAAIMDIDIEHVQNQIRILADQFNSLINGNFNLHNRGHVTAEQMARRGWEIEGAATATFAQNFQVSDRGGNEITIKVTPILENGRILTPEELRTYVERNINGAANLLEADRNNLIIAVAPGWDEHAFDELNGRLAGVRQQHTDLWLSIQDNIERFSHMSDEGLFAFITQQFGMIPTAARDAIADALRMLGDGQTTMQEAIESIFALPMEGAATVLGNNLMSLSQEQINAIEEWERLSIAYAEATTEADRARIAAEKERLALAQEWFQDAQGSWHLDEAMTQELFEIIEEIRNVQVEKLETLSEMYDEDYRRFSETQQKKLLSVKRFHDEVMRSSSNLFNMLSSNMQRWVDNVGTVLNQIGQAISQMNVQLQQITMVAANVQAAVVQTQAQVNLIGANTPGVTTTINIPRFASGGLNRGAGLRFLDPNEQVLTAEQTRAFSELVFGLGSDGMRNITDSIRSANVPSVGTQGRSLVEANFNFNAGVTQEALPEVKKMIGNAVSMLKGEIPTIVATEQRNNMTRIGMR